MKATSRHLAAMLVGACACISALPAMARQPVRVVAAESSYGSMVQTIGGDHVHVVSLIDSPAVNPHAFEGTAKIGRELSGADLVVMNGLGFDHWMDNLLEGTESESRIVVKAEDAAPSIVLPDKNEHLFYSPRIMLATAGHVEKALAKIDPDNADAYEKGLDAFAKSLTPIYARVQDLIAHHPDTPIGSTVPVYGYMLALLGYPEQFHGLSYADMHGTQPSAKQVNEALEALKGHKVALLVYNVQVTNQLTDRLVDEAKKAGVPTVGVSAIPLHGEDYAAWQVEQLDAIKKALDGAS
ncbi:metal ABC transporter solute-binding protein, Zn/Mn family [Pararhizobium mangrovi]|uniref:ABC transporter substrate-binding protein n=1 Tax=Pararhizobium mangrovi TaxID=2590452 RepID=A0A506TXK1_9HYPH|nr:zinc ABC transporter substrate-binding protein [Pararhizobium mangrovi]TPW25898.1 ABC transporter substrate-binding protein [Pararhizobium mangrovi]